jgi:hypothetical protein
MALLVSRLTVFIALLSLSIAAYASDCSTRFGQLLGTTNEGVPAYSACGSPNLLAESFGRGHIYLGLKWQCVEFARRWLYETRGQSFPSVDYAHQMWTEINHLVRVRSGKKIPLYSHANGSKSLPRVGDLLIYDEAFKGTGHVAVILEIDWLRKVVKVGEQNYLNELWPASYARELPLVRGENGIWILDTNLIGWKSVKP